MESLPIRVMMTFCGITTFQLDLADEAEAIAMTDTLARGNTGAVRLADTPDLAFYQTQGGYIRAFRLPVEPAPEDPPTYTHVYSIDFEVHGSRTSDGSDVNPVHLHNAIIARAQDSFAAGTLREACGEPRASTLEPPTQHPDQEAQQS